MVHERARRALDRDLDGGAARRIAEAQGDGARSERELPISRLSREGEILGDVSSVAHDDRVRHGVAGHNHPALGRIPRQRGGPADDLGERHVRRRVGADDDGYRRAIDDRKAVLRRRR